MKVWILSLGLMPVVMGIVALVVGLRRNIIFFLTAAILLALAMSPLSASFWNAAPIAALVQFPWRLLALSVLTMAWLAGAALETVQSPKSKVTPQAQSLVAMTGHETPEVGTGIAPTALLMLVTVLASFSYTLPQYTERSLVAESARAAVDFELVSYKDRTGYMTWASAQPQGSPLVAEYRAEQPLMRAVALSADAEVESLHQGGASQQVRVRSPGGATLQFRIYYFPGWRARVDGQPVVLWPSGPYALITLAVPAGEHVVDLRFEETTVRFAAKMITLLTIWAMLGWVVLRRKR